MIKRYDEARARKLRIALVADNLFCMVHGVLKMQPQGATSLCDVEIWDAARSLSQSLKDCPAPEILVNDFVSELEADVSVGHDTFWILLVSVCQLSAQRKKITNADTLIRLLLPYCHRSERYYSLLEQLDGKEQQMARVGKKVDLLTYEIMQLEDADPGAAVEIIETFISASMSLGSAAIVDNLLVLNYLNLQQNHLFDKQILSMYEQLIKQAKPQPSIELTMGNKNVAQQGAMQMNGNLPADGVALLSALNQLKMLK